MESTGGQEIEVRMVELCPAIHDHIAPFVECEFPESGKPSSERAVPQPTRPNPVFTGARRERSAAQPQSKQPNPVLQKDAESAEAEVQSLRDLCAVLRNCLGDILAGCVHFHLVTLE